jgi:hypothetical protein
LDSEFNFLYKLKQLHRLKGTGSDEMGLKGSIFKPPSLHCERRRLSPPLYFELLKLLNLDFNADPEPASIKKFGRLSILVDWIRILLQEGENEPL